jgi:membrane protein DedA with SNARE-associated domain
MHSVMEFLTRHGYAALFAAVLAEQLGLPVPATPFLIAAGALAGLDQLSLPRALGVAIIASLTSDLAWFYFGKCEKILVARLLSWLSLKPEACTSQQRRRSTRSILFSKFLPGLSLLISPLAGVMGVAIRKFLALQSTAALLWAGAYMSLGWVFRGQLERVGAIFERFGTTLGVPVTVFWAGYLTVKYLDRRRQLNPAIRSKEAHEGFPQSPSTTSFPSVFTHHPSLRTGAPGKSVVAVWSPLRIVRRIRLNPPWISSPEQGAQELNSVFQSTAVFASPKSRVQRHHGFFNHSRSSVSTSSLNSPSSSNRRAFTLLRTSL